MSRWVTISIATSLAVMASPQLWGWGPPRGAQHSSEPQMSSSSFPLNDQQQWYTKESYLLWHPHEDDVDWADRVKVENSSELHLSTYLKKPDFGWYSGVRVALGRYLANHDHWDVSFTTTYFYANTENHAFPNISKNVSLQPLWSPVLVDTGLNKGEGTWRLNFFTFDLGLGRNTFVSSKLTAHPFVDLRTAFIYENDAAKYSFAGSVSPTVTSTTKIRFKGFNDYWGIGPRLGSDFSFYLSRSWTLLGSLSGSLLLGGSKVGQFVHHFQQTVVSGNPTDSKQKFHVSNHEFAIRGNLEGSLGIGWEKWMKRNRVRLAPSFVFEASQWYDANQWIVLKSPSAVSTSGPSYFETDRRHGDLTFWGFNFNIQVDF